MRTLGQGEVGLRLDFDGLKVKCFATNNEAHELLTAPIII